MRVFCLATILAAASFGAAHAGELITNGNFQTSGCVYGTGNPCSEQVGPYGINNSTEVTGWVSNGYNVAFLPNTATTTYASTEYGQNDLGLWGTANGGPTWDGNGPAGYNGNYMALDGDYQAGSMSQTITGLTAGQGYYVTFYFAFAQQYGFNGGTIQNLLVALGGVPLQYTGFNGTNYNAVNTANFQTTSGAFGTGASLASHGFSGWQQETMWFRADSASDVLSFLAWGNVQVPPFALLADVSMVDAPEPLSVALLIVGMTAVGVAARKRKRATT
jgi:hypothetical protein